MSVERTGEPAAGRVYVVGVGAAGAASLTPPALALVREAQVLAGGARLLAMFPEVPALRVVLKADLESAVRELRRGLEADPPQQTVVLASGDPGFYGIARRLVQAMGRERVEVVPNVSAVQLAFAALGESWEDALLLSVHGRPIEDILARLAGASKAAVLTDGEHSPGAIAAALLAAGVDGFRAYVCQDLGGPEERVVESDLAGLVEQEFAPLNVLVLLREDRPSAPTSLPSRQRGEGHRRAGACPPPGAVPAPSAGRPGGQPAAHKGLPYSHKSLVARRGGGEGWTCLFGIPDDQFDQQRPPGGLITKAEVRAVALARLGLRRDSIVWDIGAGSGAVAVEAARLCSAGRVFAVERNPAAVQDIRANIGRFGVPNLTVVEALAPEGLDSLPEPDAVFVGGSGGQMEAILEAVCRRLRPGGRVVISLATLENLSAAVAGLGRRGLEAEVTQVSISRSRAVAGLTRLQALNPVFLVTGHRENHRCEIKED